jgi:hypothetical protein
MRILKLMKKTKNEKRPAKNKVVFGVVENMETMKELDVEIQTDGGSDARNEKE